MAVLTQKEFEEFKEIKSASSSNKKHTARIAEKIEVRQEQITEPEPKIMYILIHPENAIDCLQNFEDEVTIDGNTYKRVCRNGAVRTKEKKLADYLLKNEYRILTILKGEITDG